MQLSDLLAKELDRIDVRTEPRRVAEGATLLELVQQMERERERLSALVDQFVDRRTANTEASSHRSLADRAYEVLSESPGPMPYREIAAEIRGRGFKHASRPKSPNQLADSVWSAMYEDSKARFVKVGRGVWDLRARHGAERSP